MLESRELSVRIRLLTTICATLLLILASCAPNNTPTPTSPPPTATITPISLPTPPVGWRVHSQKSFQLALPNSWEEIPIDESSLKQKIETTQNDNPPLADTLRGLLDSGLYKSVAFYAADTGNSTGVTNVEVMGPIAAVGVTADEMAKQAAANLTQSIRGVKIVKTQALQQLDGAQAAEVDYEFPLVNSAGAVVRLRGMQFLFVTASNQAFVLTVTGSAARADTLAPIATQIAESFVVKN